MAKKIVTTSLNLSKTSYNYNGGSIPGSKQATSHNIPDLINELRYTNGQMGSVQITTSYTFDNEKIATGWYSYIYIPHRIGGKNGAASGDNANFGNLLLTGMTLATKIYKIRLHGSSVSDYTSIGEVQVFARMSEVEWQKGNTITMGDFALVGHTGNSGGTFFFNIQVGKPFSDNITIDDVTINITTLASVRYNGNEYAVSSLEVQHIYNKTGNMRVRTDSISGLPANIIAGIFGSIEIVISS